jgi:hypothetical protein
MIQAAVLRGPCEGSPTRTRRRPEPVAGEPLASLTLTRQTCLMDRLFSMTPGVAYTIVNPGPFADAYLQTIGLA